MGGGGGGGGGAFTLRYGSSGIIHFSVTCPSVVKYFSIDLVIGENVVWSISTLFFTET